MPVICDAFVYSAKPSDVENYNAIQHSGSLRGVVYMPKPKTITYDYQRNNDDWQRKKTPNANKKSTNANRCCSIM